MDSRDIDSLPATRMAPLVGRILLSLIYVHAGFHKIATFTATASEIAAHGLPLPHLLAAGALAVEIVGGLMLIIGWQARWAALVLCLYRLVLATVFHAFWAAPAAQESVQFSFFFGHLAMMGGLLFVFAFGPGPLSVDLARNAAETQPLHSRA